MEKKELEQANCIGEDTEIFFPEGNLAVGNYRTAKDICCECPVIESCLNQALSEAIDYGVWGGATPEERKTMLRDKQMRGIHLNMMKDRAKSAKPKQKPVK